MMRCQQTPQEWYTLAARYYVDRHQGCAWCGQSYRVFHTQEGSRQEYSCTGCDFRTGHDGITHCYYSYPGEKQLSAKRKTMLKIRRS